MEALIRAPLEALWAHTQQPTLHERWDLRFSTIHYLPRAADHEAQRFVYATRLGGLSVSGEGETVGHRESPDGSRASALRFWSDHAMSLIREGSGYWKYVPTTDGVRFLTSYDYRTRFGIPGRLFDRFLFRPLIGWATAWSFDRLRLWLERGLSPSSTLRMAAIHAVARVTLAAAFVYHGLVLKLVIPAADEIAMIRAAGFGTADVPVAITIAGLAELALAMCLVAFWHRSVPSVLCVLFALATTIGVGVISPERFVAAFNPVTLNAGILALALVDLIAEPGSPSAGRCRRRPRER